MKSAARSRFAVGSIDTSLDAVRGCGLIASPPPVASPPFARVVAALAPPHAAALG
ncbi:hypothetical protein GWC77_19695 [Paraburkholderia sp. NMBU_R16]|uniref:hypothetical protein n=1 Tax=Paraburkholderia sp. NMBU_R16 TaxID=2698676 RepID=UPI0015630721|nr:hypothetical protein [Paraburkholderia sp. NMBU_R16]NRO98154.1 hypothetical protein [Paraburkholderia sp. NMBU_R16]